MSRKVQQKFYLHLMDGRPAYYDRYNAQIVYMEDSSRWRDEIGTQRLRSSLNEIKRDQRLTKQHRKEWGFEDDAAGQLGYAIVRLPRTSDVR